MKYKMKPLAEENLYDVLVAPIVTEKSSAGMAYNQYTFKVLKNSTKHQVKQAVEHIFGVTVLSVNTILMKGKTKRFKGRLGMRSDWKKAIVTLKQGQTIDTSVGN